MHIERLAILGGGHQLFGARPILELGVVQQTTLLQLLQSCLVVVLDDFRSLFHHGKRRPALRIDDIGILECFSHRVDSLVRSTVRFRVLLGDFFNFAHHVVPFRVSEHDIHSEAGEKSDDSLRNGKRLAVGGTVRPCHRHFLALEIFHASKMVDYMEHIRHRLCRVVDVALKVHQRRSLFQHPLVIPFLHSISNLLHIGVAFANIHIISNSDDIRHETDHISGFPNGLAVSDLALLFIEILDFQAKQVTGAGKAEPGSR